MIAPAAKHEVEVPKKKLVGKDSGTDDNSTGHIRNNSQKIYRFCKVSGSFHCRLRVTICHSAYVTDEHHWRRRQVRHRQKISADNSDVQITLNSEFNYPIQINLKQYKIVISRNSNHPNKTDNTLRVQRTD